MGDKLSDRRVKFSVWYVLAAVIALTLIRSLVGGTFFTQETELAYSAFKDALRRGEVARVEIAEDRISGSLKDDEAFYAVRVEDPGLLAELEAHEVEIQGVPTTTNPLATLLGWILPMALMLGFWYWMLTRMKGGAGGGGLFSFGKSKPRLIKGEQTGVMFKDAGGASEAVVELREITEFLKSPGRFQRLGGKMPKGALLVGPPGTGKTLLARATAGEAGVTFFSLSGAEFVELFVGVGASRVRDLFEQAKKSAPCMVFIDEIDAIGGRRGTVGSSGAHEEREQTLNQLLAEMDGFETSQGVIVMAATNRPEVLDPALLRPGRFDRQIMVDLPDLRGREDILRIHAARVRLGGDVDLAAVARMTPGFSGAELANVVNEAALLGARQGSAEVAMAHLEAAIERVIGGTERRTLAMSMKEKRVVAVHEAGHALMAALQPGADPVHKVSIVPRGRALGYTWQRPAEDRYVLSEGDLRARLAVLLAGRVAEAIALGEISTGAEDDLAKASELARRMVTHYGMSAKLGPVRLASQMHPALLGGEQGLDPRVSQATAAQVDTETQRLLEEAMAQAWERLEADRTALDRLADRVFEHEVVDGAYVVDLLGGKKEANGG